MIEKGPASHKPAAELVIHRDIEPAIWEPSAAQPVVVQPCVKRKSGL